MLIVYIFTVRIILCNAKTKIKFIILLFLKNFNVIHMKKLEFIDTIFHIY